MPHSAIAIEYPRFSGINLERDFCAVGHSASEGEKPTDHEWPMGKVHARTQGGKARVWPWIGGEHSSGLGWLLAGFGRIDTSQRTVHSIRNRLREFFRPHIDGMTGFVAHCSGGFDSRSTEHFDCFLFFHDSL